MIMKKLAYTGLLTALALILGYLESLIPPIVPVPGIKMGFANIVVVFTLYKIGVKEAVMVNIVRVIVSGLLFGTMFSLAYSMAGAVLSLIIMCILYKKTDLDVATVSVCGSIMHIIGQVAVAIIVVGSASIISMLPFLLLSAFIMGAIIGLLAKILMDRIRV